MVAFSVAILGLFSLALAVGVMIRHPALHTAWIGACTCGHPFDPAPLGGAGSTDLTLRSALFYRCPICGSRRRLCATDLGLMGILVLLIMAAAWQMLRVEAAPALLAALVAQGSLLVVILAMDWKTRVIPDDLLHGLLWVSVASLILQHGGDGVALQASLLGGVMAYTVLALPGVAFSAIHGRSMLGPADPKLAGALGLTLGWAAVGAFLIVAGLLGLILRALPVPVDRRDALLLAEEVGMAAPAEGGRAHGRPVPFGPSLILACLVLQVFPGVNLLVM
jgi:prepilin signal peptidase PulO-like enzyme (type II secretory pathway)